MAVKKEKGIIVKSQEKLVEDVDNKIDAHKKKLIEILEDTIKKLEVEVEELRRELLES
jgi:hypothetical protein